MRNFFKKKKEESLPAIPIVENNSIQKKEEENTTFKNTFKNTFKEVLDELNYGQEYKKLLEIFGEENLNRIKYDKTLQNEILFLLDK